jgi:outer membrane protein with beta-barrel domain
LFNIARALHANGDRQEALEHYRRYLAEAPTSSVADEAREFAAGLEKELAPAPAPVEPAAPPPVEPAAAPRSPEAEAEPEPAAPQPEPLTPPAETAPVTRPHEVSRLRGGGFAGMSIAILAYDEWHGGARVGLSAGGFVSYAPLPAFALRLEAAYVQKGTGDDRDYSSPWHTDYLQAALLAEGQVWRAHAGLGPYAGLRVAVETPFGDDIKSRDLGLLAGAGLSFPLGPGDLTFDLRYAHGLSSVKTGVDAKNRMFVIALGYATRARAPR